MRHPVILPPPLRPGDTVRFVSPASPPDRAATLAKAALVESWGLAVDVGAHAFATAGYLAGTDAQRLSDLDDAIRARPVRAILATRGGKGSYRIADWLDFAALRRDPKLIVGFSDITALHLAALTFAGVAGRHGGLVEDAGGRTADALRDALFGFPAASVAARPDALSARLTTAGRAGGRLIGGNLDMIATTAGWALPDLAGAVLFFEVVNMEIGRLDRVLTMPRKAGRFDRLAGVAVGDLSGFSAGRRDVAVALIRECFAPLAVPVLGCLPLGHEAGARAVPIGAPVVLDADAGVLVSTAPVRMGPVRTRP